MRCPKCKFISYDDLAACAKCAHDLLALSTELHGTCTETNLDFFLAPVIQTPSFDDESLSESQALPPIEHGEINFDDTSTGGFAPYGGQKDQDLDDSIGVVSEDDIAIELGDIMPIDLDQLDATSLAPEDRSPTLSLDSDSAADFDDTSSTTPGMVADIDLDLTGKFASTNLGLDAQLDELDFDDTNLGGGDDSSGLSFDSTADDTILALDQDKIAGGSTDSDLDLDDDLMAELADSSDDLDATATFASGSVMPGGADMSATGEFSVDNESLELDDSLISELADEGAASDEFSVLDFDAVDTGEFSATGVSPAAENAGAGYADSPIEDLTGEFPPIDAGQGPELSSLDFSDIDVSDLVASTDAAAGDITEVSADDGDELDLDQLDESDLGPIDTSSLKTEEQAGGSPADDALPEVELFLEDDENGPPDLPS